LSAKDKQSSDANRLIAERLNSPENKVRHAEFEKMAAADDAKRSAVTKIFDPVALLKRASEIQEFTHPTLGIVRFGELTLNDSAALEKCPTPAAKTAMTLYLMLKKANQSLPEYTPDNILEFYNVFPLAEGAALLQFISEQPSFLPKKTLKNGLPSTLEPKT
jgi:hypothetical protein